MKLSGCGRFFALLAVGLGAPGACATFNGTDDGEHADAGEEASLLDVVDAAPTGDADAGTDVVDGCATTPLVFEDSFPTAAFDSHWTQSTSDGGTLTIGAADGSATYALYARTILGDGGASGHATATGNVFFDGSAPRTVDLSFLAQMPPAPPYATVGCALFFKDNTRVAFTAAEIDLAKTPKTSDLHLGTVLTEDGVNGTTTEVPFNVSLVATPKQWYAFSVHIDVNDTNMGSARATLQPLGGAPSSASIDGFSLPSRTDVLSISCGVIFTNQGPGQIDAVVDDVHLSVCPR